MGILKIQSWNYFQFVLQGKGKQKTVERMTLSNIRESQTEEQTKDENKLVLKRRGSCVDIGDSDTRHVMATQTAILKQGGVRKRSVIYSPTEE